MIVKSENDSKENIAEFEEQANKVHNFKLIEIDGRKYQNNKLKNYLENELIPSIKNKLATIDT